MASGDVVNTAARIQTAAPSRARPRRRADVPRHRTRDRVRGGRRRSRRRARRSRSPSGRRMRARRASGSSASGGAPLVGREQELTLLRETLARVIREREPQLVTLVGVPGIGKSRLVFELFQAIETRRARARVLASWPLAAVRRRRHLLGARGDGQGAGRRPRDGRRPSRTEAKLREAVAALVSDPADAEWLESHLRPLVGLEATGDTGGDRRDEAFAAWRRFFEALAEKRPLVLVFEDLHWADDALLDFVDYLVDWATGVPILVLGTARPELLSRRPGWGGGKPNALTLSLSPLSDDETAQLVHALLERPLLDADVQRTLLERAGGNPLYARSSCACSTSADDDLAFPRPCKGSSPPASTRCRRRRRSCSRPRPCSARSSGSARSSPDRAPVGARSGCMRSSARSSSGASAGRPSPARSSTRSATCLPATLRTGRSARARARRHHRAAALDRVARSARGPRGDGRPPLPVGARALALGRSADRRVRGAPPATALREAGDRAFALNSFAGAARFYGEALALGSGTKPRRPISASAALERSAGG